MKSRGGKKKRTVPRGKTMARGMKIALCWKEGKNKIEETYTGIIGYSRKLVPHQHNT